ncbi:MAG TPA: endolytic transglycosylase MltG [Bacteroidetes bacterium]|nr:endolytic transglycosylase MltG [Bacteroidota bacterium]
MWRLLKIALIVLLLIGGGGAALVWHQAFRDNVNPELKADFDLLIPKGATFAFVLKTLESNQVLRDVGAFERVSKVRKYDKLVKPGRYTIHKGTHNWELVRKLRSGDQDQMKLLFRSHRTLSALAEEIAGQLSFSTELLEKRMNDDDFLRKYGTNHANVRNLFLPNTYFVYWTMSVEELFERLQKNYDQFWNASRLKKAEALGMTRHEVTTLASIVQAETYMAKERPIVAGLYLNRLRKNIPLQADPTVIFAVGDFSIKRVLKSHLEFESPYNTYLHTGLPPGPINNPEVSAIEGVLDFKQHKYIFMCAKEDFSGYHNFSTTLAQHNRYARAYQRALNKKKVYK